MTSRLDRLLSLLDTGSTEAIRRSAVEQIGEVQRLHPHELNNLLKKVHPYLYSSQWDTRIAAGLAVEAIATRVPNWQPQASSSSEMTCSEHDPAAGKLQLSQCDIYKVLANGATLFGSQGAEYDVHDIDELSQKEHLARQKQLLNKTLGLEGGVGLPVIGEELFKEEDLIIESSSMHGCVPQNASLGIEKMINDAANRNSSDAIQTHNQSKRKMSQLCSFKHEESSSMEAPVSKIRRTTSVVVEQPGSDKILVDNVPDMSVNIEAVCKWPFDSFCEALVSDIFHSNWERRHGSLTALRHIVKLHGNSAGKATQVPTHLLETANRLWLEDLSVRLLCVLALDRFGDFVSDEVIAPVRETCAQVLGVTSIHLDADCVHNIARRIVQFLTRSEWEVRHGGLLALKYILAARQDIAMSILDNMMPVVIQSLSDQSDDVRSVAAVSLLPVVDALVTSVPQQIGRIVSCLWSVLDELDDLTSSTNNILELLSSILVHPQFNHTGDGLTSAVQLIPKLWPFLSHSIRSVRRAALRTVSVLLATGRLKNSAETSSSICAILPDALRYIYQRCLLETDKELLPAVVQAWSELISCGSASQLVAVAEPVFSTFMCLMMQPSNVPFDQSLLLDSPKHVAKARSSSNTKQYTDVPVQLKYYIGGTTMPGEIARDRDNTVVHARLTAAKLLGTLLARVIDVSGTASQERSPAELLSQLFIFYLSSRSVLQKCCTAYVISEWAAALTLSAWQDSRLPDSVCVKLHECLEESIYYDEVLVAFSRLQTECREFVTLIQSCGAAVSTFDCLPDCVLSLDQANTLCSSVFESVRTQLSSKSLTLLEQRRSTLQSAVSQTTKDQLIYMNRVQASIAEAVVRWNCLPDKMNPVVRPLMDALRREENTELQERAACSLSLLVKYCITRETSPNAKIIKNLCSMLCSDPRYTPVVSQDSNELPTKSVQDSEDTDALACASDGILTLHIQQKTYEPGRGRRPAVFRPTLNWFSSDACFDATSSDDDSELLIQRRGAMLALTAIVRDADTSLQEKLPSFWDAIFYSVTAVTDSLLEECDVGHAQELVNSLQVLQVVMPAMHSSLHSQLLSFTHNLLRFLEHPISAVRHMACRCLAVYSRILTSAVMEQVICHIVPLLGASDNVICRQGAIEAIALIIDHLGIEIVPYATLLVVPVLGRMSDQCKPVRLMAVTCFGLLIRLMPLDKRRESCMSPAVLSKSLMQQKEKESHFLEQLLDPHKIDDYQLPIPINAELRKYQQDGVNWLAFLARYQLHGILCDDMGLGKTLQALCILASDHYQRARTFQETGQADCRPLPSIVVCPPTVTGHWLYEIEKFIGREYLNPLHYIGTPTDRQRLQKQLSNHNVVLASYDVVRNDIDFFCQIHWNYCILDEGHVIKNSKTKLSKAVKQLSCNHRLVLTGTPIQNNVLELWSLFDFLMPGFLGSEREFQAAYGRPILQSRDAKSSVKDKEAGVLAMESLHRQVLPFLLRRLKDEVLNDLPPKIIQDYYCELSQLQVQLYEDFAKSSAKKSVVDSLQEEQSTATNNAHIFQALQYLHKLCSHPSLVVTPRHPQYTNITASLQRAGTSLRDIQHAPKLVALQQLLSDCGIGVTDTAAADVAPAVNQHRVLIFCQLKSMLDIVEYDLLQARLPTVTYLRLDGSVPAGSRYSIVNKFNSDPSIDVLLLTTHVGGLGLNLTGADTVIFIEHDWNPMKDLQAMDRAHRIGQKKVVNVYRLIMRNTLEEKIMGLQKFKMNIANTVVNADNRSLASMATDQLLDLFSLGASQTDRKPSSAAGHNVESVLGAMEELWDTQQYDSEYNLESFVENLK